MKRVMVFLVSLLAAVFGLIPGAEAAAAAVESSVPVYAYGSPQPLAQALCATSEGAPPNATYDYTACDACDACDQRPHGAAARVEGAETGSTTTYAYATTPAWVAPATTTSGSPGGASDGALSRSSRSGGAAKTVPRQIDASWGGVTNYKHGGLMTAIEHINYRHAYGSGFTAVSKFSPLSACHRTASTNLSGQYT